MKDLVIISCGDFARETMWIAERMNLQYPQWNILGFVDDNHAGENVDGYPVLGTIEWLKQYPSDIYTTCAIGTGATRKKIWEKLSGNENIHPATLIDPAVIVGKDVVIGEGSILCAGTVLTIAVKTGFNCIVNLNCTLGHDAVLQDYSTIHPGCNISGKVSIGECCDIGTGTKIIQGKNIAPYTIIGAGSVVVKNLEESGTYVGVPVKKIK